MGNDAFQQLQNDVAMKAVAGQVPSNEAFQQLQNDVAMQAAVVQVHKGNGYVSVTIGNFTLGDVDTAHWAIAHNSGKCALLCRRDGNFYPAPEEGSVDHAWPFFY